MEGSCCQHTTYVDVTVSWQCRQLVGQHIMIAVGDSVQPHALAVEKLNFRCLTSQQEQSVRVSTLAAITSQARHRPALWDEPQHPDDTVDKHHPSHYK